MVLLKGTMNEDDAIGARRLPDRTIVQFLADGTMDAPEDRTDWARLNAMTEEEIEANAPVGPDNSPMSATELARMRSVPNPREIRRRMRLT